MKRSNYAVPLRFLMAVPLAAAVLAASGGCGFDPASVPVPGAEVSGPTHRIQMEFTSALNLPARAKVMANGVRVGTVADVRVVDPAAAPAKGGYVIVDVDILDSVQLPVSTIGELRQNTVLGDIHIALTTPPNGVGAKIPAGGTIPLTQTKPPVQLEDTMAGLATFIQGGAIGRMQDAVNKLNGVLPADPKETARIADVLHADYVDLGNNLAQVDSFLNGIGADASTVAADAPAIKELLTDYGVTQTSAAVSSVVGVVGVLGQLGAVGHALIWAAPLVDSADAAAKAFLPLAFTGRPLDLSAPSNLNKLVALLRDKIIPFVERGPKVNITGATVSGPDTVAKSDQVDRIVDTLRMIGAVR
ncbi:MlaD family protein [Nocardia sp. NPDC052001]|uniref:MlaD family protein n=1 Tax=Nocardia sp. NPDC052001 TaxID=3154853 RepID=UPI003412BB4B